MRWTRSSCVHFLVHVSIVETRQIRLVGFVERQGISGTASDSSPHGPLGLVMVPSFGFVRDAIPGQYNPDNREAVVAGQQAPLSYLLLLLFALIRGSIIP